MKHSYRQYCEELLATTSLQWITELLNLHTTAEVFVVGGSVRDLMLGRESNDLDFVVRNVDESTLETFLSQQGEINAVGKSFGVFVFKPTGYEGNAFEIALPRTEESFNTGKYHDFKIHSDPHLPIEHDLARRDITINAMALNIVSGALIDPFGGSSDCEAKIIRTVGDPAIRFGEDYTRMLRAVRFSAQLGFEIDPQTLIVIQQLSKHITSMAPERIQQEVNKILTSPHFEHGMNYFKESKLLEVLFPELAQGYGVVQGKSHIYDVYTHLMKAASYANQKGYSLEIIMASLFHDCGKPKTQKFINGVDTYYQHEYVGEKMVKDALKRYKYPVDFIKKVAHLVRNHMFYYNQGEVSDAGVRRLIVKVGPEHINDLLRLRMCDRIGMGRPKAKPFKLEELEQRVAILLTDPISPNMIALDGDAMMKLLNIKPSIRLKHLKNALLAEVLEDPSKNNIDHQSARVIELNKLTDEELIALAPDIEQEEEQRQKDVLKNFKGVK
ncbi:HD domain-containing protein [Candidatus Falkowbacteria bacterium]|nr:HD domain-containing protein [Candidatus Falkowbacteria bacterium]